MLGTFILLSCAPEYLLRLPAPQVLARVVAKLPASYKLTSFKYSCVGRCVRCCWGLLQGLQACCCCR